MPQYNAPLLQTAVSTTYKSGGVLYASSGTQARRAFVREITPGQSAGLNTTNDTQVLWDVSRFTTTSLLAGSTVLPSPVDTADPASLAVYINAVTTEVAVFAAAGSGLSLLNFAFNQRSPYRWRTMDSGPTVDAIVIPATNLSGIAVRVLSISFTGSAAGTIGYVE